MNSWLEELKNNPELRKEFQHKVVLDFDKNEFFDTSSLGYALGVLREFRSIPDSDRSSRSYAWYYLPMLSDTDSAEFIRFTKDDADGYQDRLLKKMMLTVFQEWNRIKLVSERKEKGATEIPNFDKRGLKFCFIPQLNDYKEGDKSFFDIMREAEKNKDEAKANEDKAEVARINRELSDKIISILRRIVEQDVDETYKKFLKLGVFDRTESGSFKYIEGYSDNDTLIQGNKAFIRKAINNNSVDKWSSDEQFRKFNDLAEKYINAFRNRYRKTK